MAGDENLRIGDAERERVRDILQRHAAEGRLTLDELSDRLGEVYAARTAADLDRALRELPPPPRDRRSERRWRSAPPPAIFAALLIGVWALLAATTGTWFFWPLFPLLFIFFRFGGPRGMCGPARGNLAPPMVTGQRR